MKYKIYKLVYYEEVIYVGKTELRLLCMRKAVGYPLIPIEVKQESFIELIEETDDITREDYWITYYRDLGCNLYNKIRGSGVYNKKERSKEYYENNKQTSKEYYEKNKDKIKDRQKEFRKNNKEKVKIYEKRYRDNNKEKIKEKRRIKKLSE